MFSNAADTKEAWFFTNERICICIENTSTYLISMSGNGGTMRAFSSNDCTGSYTPINEYITDAYWANSFSFGPSGSSTLIDSCINFYGSNYETNYCF